MGVIKGLKKWYRHTDKQRHTHTDGHCDLIGPVGKFSEN